MVDAPKIQAVSAIDGERFVIVDQNDVVSPVSHETFTGSNATIATALRARGIHIIGGEMMNALVKKVAALNVFHPANLATRVGWNVPHFVLPDGSAISPSKSDGVMVALDEIEDRCAQSGDLKGWKRGVAKRLTDQSLAKFALMLPFMPPLLRLTSRSDNFGFEIVGKKGAGKSTLQYLAASVVGSPVRGKSQPYWSTWDTTLNALEDAMPLSSDMLIIAEEAALFFADESKSKRAHLFKAFAFKAAAGSTKARLGRKQDASGYRYSYLSSSNVSLTDLLGDDSETSSAAADRLITINIPPDRPNGAFDFVPEGYGSGSEFAATLMTAAIANHGVAFRHYMRGLVDARARDEDSLLDSIRHYIGQFRRATQVDLNDGSAVRVADAFGLVYAAGRLASNYGALPRHFECGAAALAVYRLHKAGVRHVPFSDRLEQIVEDDATLVLERGNRGLSDKALKKAQAVLDLRGHRPRLLILPPFIEQFFPDWNSLRRRQEVRKAMRYDKGHLTTKVQLSRKDPQQRAYVFQLPPRPDLANDVDAD